MSRSKSQERELDFTPAAPQLWLYDFLCAVLTREKTWRSKLLAEIQPGGNDRIADVGCGTASLIKLICENAAPEKLIGIDPDADVLDIARTKTRAFAERIEYKLGYARDAHVHLDGLGINKIVSSLMFHQVPLDEKRKGLASMYTALVPNGQLYIADFGLQRTRLMRKLFTIAQKADGYENTQPNADGILIELMHEAGFTQVMEAFVIPTPTGSFSIYRAMRGAA